MHALRSLTSLKKYFQVSQFQGPSENQTFNQQTDRQRTRRSIIVSTMHHIIIVLIMIVMCVFLCVLLRSFLFNNQSLCNQWQDTLKFRKPQINAAYDNFLPHASCRLFKG